MFLREKGAALSILYTLYNLYTLHNGEKARLPLHLFPYLLKREGGRPSLYSILWHLKDFALFALLLVASLREPQPRAGIARYAHIFFNQIYLIAGRRF